MLPYFIALLVLGIPLCWAEWTMGRYAGTRGFNSAPGIFSVIWQNPVAKYFGSIALLIPLIIYMYYVLIESWCLLYALDYLTGAIYQRGDTTFAEHFSSVTGKNGDGELIQSGYMGLIILLITFGLNFLLIYRGVTKGIEALCRVAMPLMAVLAIIVLVRVLTLGTPDPTKPGQSVIGGFGLALASDIRIAGPKARMNAAFIRIGLSACDVGVSYFLPRLVGASLASELLLTGRFIDAARAERLGLVSSVVPDDELVAAARSMANEILANSPIGVRLTKDCLNMSIDAPSLDSVVAMEDRQQILISQTQDMREGVGAFLEKRAPVFTER